jgi:hypothetical protein
VRQGNKKPMRLLLTCTHIIVLMLCLAHSESWVELWVSCG